MRLPAAVQSDRIATSGRSRDGLLGRVVTAGIRHYPAGQGPDGRLGNRGFSLNLVLRGSGTFRDHHGTVHLLRPGTAFQRVGELDHETRFDPAEPCSEAFISLGLPLATPMRAAGLLRVEPACLPLAWDAALPRRFAALIDAITAGDDARLALAAALALIGRVYALHDAAVGAADAVEALRRRLSDAAELPLAAVAIAPPAEEAALRRAFRLRFGLPAAAYHQAERMRLACQLLEDLPVAAVAQRLGYADAFAFSKQFRRAMGVAPSAWRGLSPDAAPARRRGGPTVR